MLRPEGLPPVQYDPIAFSGGLDLITPAYSLPPGALRDCLNFATNPLDGYYRVPGYERFSGQPAPSAASFTVMSATWSGVVPVVGEVATIGTLSGTISDVGNDYITLTKVAGTVPVSGPTNIVVSATVRGTSAGLYGSISPSFRGAQGAKAANIYRADILPVPGSGPIRGCIIYKNLVYAFRDNAAGTECKIYKSSVSGWVNVPIGTTLLPGGRYDMVIANFSAGSASTKIYGCDGINDPFEFDGTTYTPITSTGMVEKPTHIYAFKGHLFLAYLTSIVHSALGDPLDYQVINGAGEIGTSDSVTGMLIQPGSGDGGALAIYGRNTIWILYGTSAADWRFVTFAVGVGGIDFTMQSLADSYTLDDRGVISMKASLNYGNFDTNSITYNINPIIKSNRNLATCSSVNREKSQYRVFFSNGYGILTTIANERVVGHGLVQYPDPVLCSFDGEAPNGAPMSVFGVASGHVMQADIGSSFDGEIINGYAVTNINITKQLRIRKRFRKCVLEVQGTNYAEFSVGYNFDWASDEILQHLFENGVANLTTISQWDAFYWDNFYWDGKGITPSYIELNGSGENIQLIISSSSDAIQEFSINSAVLHYTVRRGMR